VTFIERKIDITFELANEQFGAGGNIVTVSGLRCTAMVDNINGISNGALQLRVYGMLQEDMAKCVTLGRKYMLARRNLVTVVAGDDRSGMTQIFKGTIYKGAIDYSGMPEVALSISASSSYYEQIAPTAPNSYEGDTDVATVIAAIAKSIGFTFRNNGVTAQLANPYLPGTAIAQIKDIAQAAGIACAIENGEVDIWPNGGFRDDQTVLLSKETGLVGYPEYSEVGIDVRSLFSPTMKTGRKVTVKTDLPQGSGDWYCQVVRHDLSAQMPNGPWFTTAQLTGEGMYVPRA
jgi:hypothetical protein